MSWLSPENRIHPIDPLVSYMHTEPQESYSRQLDATVYRQELPYGYTFSPPAADTHDYKEREYETKLQHHIKSKH